MCLPLPGNGLLRPTRIRVGQRVMLSYGYWQRRFGGDPGVVGRTISVDSQPRVIAGVMPRGFKVVELRLRSAGAAGLRSGQAADWLALRYHGIARLRPGVTISQANADVARLLNVWMDSWTNGPGTDPHFYLKWKITPAFQPLKGASGRQRRQRAVGGDGTIGLVMLIACTNVANLLLVRADARQQELAVRSALGAGRWRIARELLLESVTLGPAGRSGRRGRCICRTAPVDGDWAAESAASERDLAGWQSLAFTLDSFGAFRVVIRRRFRCCAMLLRSKPCRLLGAMRTASVSRERQRGRNVLVVAQVAMALVLLISAVLMIRTFDAMRNVDPGFSDPQHVQVVRISIPERWCAIRELLRDSEQHPGQAGRDSGGYLCGLRRFRSDERSRTELGSDLRTKGRSTKGTSSDAPVQLCLSWIFPYGGHKVGCRARFYLDGDLRAEADRDLV